MDKVITFPHTPSLSPSPAKGMFCMFHIAYIFIIFGQRQHEG